MPLGTAYTAHSTNTSDGHSRPFSAQRFTRQGVSATLIVDRQEAYRVFAVDGQKRVIWQYGVKGQKGHRPGLLNYPDGLDLDVFRDWKGALPKP